MKDAVDVLLTMQNANGGFASYELVRGVKQMEWLNVAEVFGESCFPVTYCSIKEASSFCPLRLPRRHHDRIHLP